tara:strand:+ start:17041 stop:18321 length:1281 start_codon:yes stop_codon:yes gene_type:complete
MPDEFEYTGPDLISGSELPSAAGKEYEYEDGYYLEMLKAQLEAMKNQFEKHQEEQEEDGILGTKNMETLNSILTIRGATESFRDSYVRKKIQMQGGFHTMEDPSAPGSGKTIDGSDAKWTFKKGNTLSKAAEIGLGWSRGIEAVDGQELIASDNNNKSTNTAESTYNPDKKLLSYATNPNTGEQDAYYTEGGVVHWKSEFGKTTEDVSGFVDDNVDIADNSSSETSSENISVDDSDNIVPNGTLADNNNLYQEDTQSSDFASNDNRDAEKERIQSYIDKDWAPEQDMDKDLYESMGGKYEPKGGWATNETTETVKNDADNNFASLLNKEIKGYEIEGLNKDFKNNFSTIETDNTRVVVNDQLNNIEQNKFISNPEKLFTDRLDINQLQDGSFTLNYGASDQITFADQDSLNTFIVGNNLTNFSSNF